VRLARTFVFGKENMPVITLPDGSTRSFEQPVTIAGVALAK
jgi:hypothetical protein